MAMASFDDLIKGRKVVLYTDNKGVPFSGYEILLNSTCVLKIKVLKVV